jgi:phage terminase large subunit-like protein
MTTKPSTSEPIFERHQTLAVPEISDYLRAIETGACVPCKDQIALAKHVRKVFAEEKLWVDTGTLARYMSYQRYFNFKLLSWEKFLIALWLCTYEQDGNESFPRWPQLLMLLGRGAGKNGFISFCAFCLVSKANGIPLYDVDICANTDEQAQTSFLDVKRILDSEAGKWKRAFSWNMDGITNKSTGSRIKHRTDNPDSKDGLRSGCVIFDELHAYTDWKNLNVFTTGLGKTPDPRRLYSTTDGDVRDGPLDKLKERADHILNDGEPDRGFLPFICRLDSDDEVNDPAMWPKANPRYLSSASLRHEMADEYEDWKLDPINNAAFMTKRMNRPQGRKEAEVASWDDLVAASRDPGDLHGKPCVIGIDFAKSSDMVGGAVLCRDGDEWQAVVHGWWCTQSADAGRIRAPLDEWANMGLVTIVDDVEISPEIIAEWCRDVERDHEVRAVGYDSYRHVWMRRALEEQGFSASGKEARCVLTRPSDIMRVQPSITSAFKRHLIAWGDNPLARWSANNAKLEPAPHNNFVYGKIEPRSRKTDPFTALVAAFCVSDRLDEPEAAPIELMQPLIFH